ncbi:MAG: hypothetical protein FWH40_08185 [Coriobacteriia bacterium]|nr:hypothetical protein [Coriobacteriia bacterium]
MNDMIEFGRFNEVEKIGKGTQGDVYEIPEGMFIESVQVKIAIKKYNESILAGKAGAIENHIRSLIRDRDDAIPDIKRIIDRHTTWPRYLVSENGKMCGFAMSLIPDAFYAYYEGYNSMVRTLSQFEFIINDDDMRRHLNLPIINDVGRAKIVYDLLLIIKTLHEYNYVIGDISSTNIIIYIDPENQRRNRALFIDVDSFRKVLESIEQPQSPSYRPPESIYALRAYERVMETNKSRYDGQKYLVQSFVQNKESDVYKIGLVILRLYHIGPRRSLIYRSSNAMNRLENEIGLDFANLIKGSLSDSAARPTALELFRVFVEAYNLKC